MSEMPPDPASGDEPADSVEPVIGVFHTSWGAALRTSVWPIVGGFVFIVVVLWILGYEDFLAFVGAFYSLWFVAEAAAYQIWGVETVEITAEALTVSARGKRPVRIVWTELREARVRYRRRGDRWLLRDGNQRVVILARGFTDDDWWSVYAAILHWEKIGPPATLLGVEAERQMPGLQASREVFVAHQPAAAFWILPLMMLCGVTGLYASWEAYGDGTWAQDLMMSVGLPLIGVGFSVFAGLNLTRLAERVTFGPDAMFVERHLGRTKTIPYADITDAFGEVVHTRQGMLKLGDRNHSSFHSVLRTHIVTGQLTGALEHRAVYENSVVWPYAFALVVVPAGLFVGSAFEWPEQNGIFLGVVFLLLVGAAVALWSRRRSRR